MSEKKPSYENLRHDLDTKMLNASNLATKPEQQGFVNRTFVGLHRIYTAKQINHTDFMKLVNRLAAFKQGVYNDYIDVLVGAASMGMLELAIQGEIPAFSPEQARQRRQAVNDLTGTQPIQPEE